MPQLYLLAYYDVPWLWRSCTAYSYLDARAACAHDTYRNIS
jgi:hypothetical protein